MAAVRFTVRGRVQGVGFRWFATQAARALDLRGWVRNAADGSVESVAAGSSEALVAFEKALRRGPAGSHVESVSCDATDDVVGERIPFSPLA